MFSADRFNTGLPFLPVASSTCSVGHRDEAPLLIDTCGVEPQPVCRPYQRGNWTYKAP